MRGLQDEDWYLRGLEDQDPASKEGLKKKVLERRQEVASDVTEGSNPPRRWLLRRVDESNQLEEKYKRKYK